RPLAAIDIPPRWRVVPASSAESDSEPSNTAPALANSPGAPIRLVIEAGAAFGTGTHETTQLCLQAIHALSPRGRDWRLLDFGSGTGILAIAAAKLGASVEAVETDPLAIEISERNALINGVDDRIRTSRTLAGIQGPFDLVV